MPLAKTGRKSCAAPWGGVHVHSAHAAGRLSALRGHRHGTDEAAVFGVRRVAGDAAQQEAQRALQGTDRAPAGIRQGAGGRRPRNRRHGTVCAHDCKPLQDRKRRKRRAGFGMPPGLRRGRARPALSAARFNRSPFRQAWLAGLGGGRGFAKTRARGCGRFPPQPRKHRKAARRARRGEVPTGDVIRFIGSDRCPRRGEVPLSFSCRSTAWGELPAGLDLRLPGGS